MKLFVKILILIVVSPYLMLPYALLTNGHEAHPPIVSQVAQVRTTTDLPVLSLTINLETTARRPVVEIPLYSDQLELCGSAWRDFKSYMNYKKITSKSSQQYKFISGFMLVDEADGFLRLESDTRFIGVALGSYFGGIGSKFKFTLESGVEFYAVKVEEKADKHIIDGCVHKSDSSIIEFVVNDNFKSYYPEASRAGNLAVLPQFEGMIIQIDIIEGK